MAAFALGTVTVDLEHRFVERGGVRLHLTTTEAALLTFLAETGRTVSRDELLQRVWGYDGRVVSRTCDTAVRRLRHKIEVDPAEPQHLLSVHGVGYRLVVQAPASAAVTLPAVAPPPPGEPGPRRYRCGDRVIDLDRVRIETPNGPAALSAYEVSLLEALADGKARETRELQRAIWGHTAGRPLHNAVTRLRRKLEPDPGRPRFLVTTGTGYRLDLSDPRDPGAPPPVLPVEADRRFGREEAVAQILRWMATERLVTLTGPGGVGKTRLALAAARALAGRGEPLVWVSAADAWSLDALFTAIARSISARLTTGDPVAELARMVDHLGGLLLVVDNVEQIEGAAGALGGLLERAAGLRLLVTSRVALRIRGERRLPVEPLALDDAVALFLDRAVRPPPDEDLPEVEALVRLLDGIPLAIELAAARTAAIGVREIRARMRERLGVLERRDPTLRPRERSVRGSLDASWHLLDPVARDALAQLTVFVGPFTVDAAETVLDVPEWTVDVLERLVDASLVRMSVDGRRLTLFEVVRLYAAEHLTDLARREAERRHGAWFSRVRELNGPRDLEAREALEADFADICAAAARAVARQDASTAVRALGLAREVWRTTGPYDAALRCAEQLRSHLVLAPAEQAEVELTVGSMLALTGDLTGAEASLRAAEVLAAPEGDGALQARVALALAMTASRASRHADVRRYAERAERLADRSGDRWLQCEAKLRLVTVRFDEGDPRSAGELLVEVERLAAASGSKLAEAVVQLRLAHVEMLLREPMAAVRLERVRPVWTHLSVEHQLLGWRIESMLQRVAGQYEEAARTSETAAALCDRAGDRLQAALTRAGAGMDWLRLGELERASAHIERSLLTCRESGGPLDVARVLRYRSAVAVERGDLDGAEHALRQALSLVADRSHQAAIASAALCQAHLGHLVWLRSGGVAELERWCAQDLGPAGPEMGLVLAEALAQSGRRDEAERWIHEATSRSGHLRIVEDHARIVRVILTARSGAVREAERLLEERPPRDTLFPSRRASLAMARAELAAARGDLTALRAALTEASSSWSVARLGARYRELAELARI